jgi:hypothetical protein
MYELTDWQNLPSKVTPLSAANLLLYNTAINDLDVRNLTITPIQNVNYMASAGQMIPVDTSNGSVTVTLPESPSDRAAVLVKHSIQGGSNTVTVASSGDDCFNTPMGPTGLALDALNQVLWLIYSAGVWYPLVYPQSSGEGGSVAYVQTVINQSLVQLNHGLPFQPAGITCIDTNGVTTDFGAITYPMTGTCEITFGFPFTGTIYLS